MKAIVLAAGRGIRMKHLTDEYPKCLIKLHGKTLLDWQLEALRGAGIQKIAIVTGYKRELLENRELKEFHNPNWANTNMVSSLACANEWLTAEQCIVSYSDIFYDLKAIESLMKNKAPVAITYDPNWIELWEKRFEDPLIDAETFRLTNNRSIAEIGNKPASMKEIEGQYMGLLSFTPEGWAELLRVRGMLNAEECDKIHMTGMLQKIIQSGNIHIDAIPYTGEWGEIDSIGDLSLYQEKVVSYQ